MLSQHSAMCLHTALPAASLSPQGAVSRPDTGPVQSDLMGWNLVSKARRDLPVGCHLWLILRVWLLVSYLQGSLFFVATTEYSVLASGIGFSVLSVCYDNQTQQIVGITLLPAK